MWRWRDSLLADGDLAEVMMRGTDRRSGELFSYVDLEQRVGRTIRCGRSARW